VPTTPIYALPYPAAADPADVPLDMQELAERVEAALPAGYGTTLPGSPFDKQEFILVDSLTAPTYAWRFRYVASISGAYKWVFIGGTPKMAQVDVQQTSTLWGGWFDLSTVGPLLTVPYLGDYFVTASAVMQHSAVVDFGIGITKAAGDPIDPARDITQVRLATAGVEESLVIVGAVPKDVSPASDIRLRYYASAAGTTYAKRRVLNVWPVRVS
jgi:hypothetical protein